MLQKKDLKLLSEFIDSGNPKAELNYALVGRGGIFATDTRKAIKFHVSECNNARDILIHKKLLKGFESTMSKDDEAAIENGGELILCGNTKMNLSTACFEHKYPDSNRILDMELDKHFVLGHLNDINFELSNKFCFIDSFQLAPLITHSGGDKYDVFYSPMVSDKYVGKVKIVASKDVDGEEKILYTAVIMGREFKSQTSSD